MNLRSWLALALSCLATSPGMAQTAPNMIPTRDVVVTYRVIGGDAPIVMQARSVPIVLEIEGAHGLQDPFIDPGGGAVVEVYGRHHFHALTIVTFLFIYEPALLVGR